MCIRNLAIFVFLLALPLHVTAQLEKQKGTYGWDEFHAGNYAAARKIWLPKARQGDGDAALGMAILYEHGLGTTQDDNQSVHWLEIAAKSGIPEAQHDLGIKYFTGRGVSQDNVKAFNLWKAAAETGLGSAQAKLAYLYTQGIGAKRDYKEALRWYRQAIKQNNGEAMYNMSLLYQNGTGVRQDKHQFHHWLRQAATYDYPRAQYDLGLMLVHGMDIERSVSEGKKWLTRSAHNGLADAQYYLGTLYLNGHILAPDRGKAIALLNDAAGQGHQGAIQTLIDLDLASHSNSGIRLGNQTGLADRTRKIDQSIVSSKPATPSKPVTEPVLLSSERLGRPEKHTIKTDRTAWLAEQNSDAFTIQLLAVLDEDSAIKYAGNLPANLNAFIFSFQRDNKRWHAVAAGIYTSYEDAAGGLNNLPDRLKKIRPWVRNVGQLKEMIGKSP